MLVHPQAVAHGAQSRRAYNSILLEHLWQFLQFTHWENEVEEFQKPFAPTHENMRNLDLSKDQPVHQLAANLRRAFSGVVSGNVKEEGIHAIEKHGHFELKGDDEIMAPLDSLLAAFVEQQRMKLPGTEYVPCYKIIK